MSAKFRSEDEEDLIRLKKMLRKVLGDDEAQVRRRLESRDETRILDIACGECREAEVLTDFIADLRGNKDGEVRLTGMDVRAREIEDAQRRFGGKRDLENRPGTRECEFLTGDASKLDQHAELGENFDFVFMRHQNYWNGAQTWEEIYDQALGKLDDECRLIITSYFDKSTSSRWKRSTDSAANSLVPNSTPRPGN
jgi:hypothetical protein